MELRIEEMQPIVTSVKLTNNDICLCHLPSTRLPRPERHVPGIDRVIFNDPATIVIWLDGTKTIVKCQKGDTFDEQTGLALCFMKKALGNSSRRFNDTLHAYIPEEEEDKLLGELYSPEERKKIEWALDTCHKQVVEDNKLEID